MGKLDAFSHMRPSEKKLLLLNMRWDLVAWRAADLPEFFSVRMEDALRFIFDKRPEDKDVLWLSRVVLNTAYEKYLREQGQLIAPVLSSYDEEKLRRIEKSAFSEEQWHQGLKTVQQRNLVLKQKELACEAEEAADLFLEPEALSQYISQVLEIRHIKEIQGVRVSEGKRWACLKAGVRLFAPVPENDRRRVGDGVRLKIEKAWNVEARQRNTEAERFAERHLSSERMKTFDGAVKKMIERDWDFLASENRGNFVEICCTLQAAVLELQGSTKDLVTDGLRIRIERIAHEQKDSEQKKALALLDPERVGTFLSSFERMARRWALPKADDAWGDKAYATVRSSYDDLLNRVPENMREKVEAALLEKTKAISLKHLSF